MIIFVVLINIIFFFLYLIFLYCRYLDDVKFFLLFGIYNEKILFLGIFFSGFIRFKFLDLLRNVFVIIEVMLFFIFKI